MRRKTILVIGTGHLAYRVKELVVAQGYEALLFIDVVIQMRSGHFSVIDAVAKSLGSVNFEAVRMAYILDEKDENNLELTIALMALHPDLPITTSLFNENIIPHLQTANPNLHILNPARIAAPYFVAALEQPLNSSTNFIHSKKPPKEKHRSTDHLVKILLTCFASLIFLATAYFHFFENLSWLDAFYFVIVTVSTVGYGDISLHQSAAMSKAIGILLILSSTIFIWMIFSLTIDRIIKKRVQLELGRKRYHYKGHIILCGLGRLGYFIAEELYNSGEKVLIVEADQDSASIEVFRQRGVAVYIGNARLPRVLKDVNVAEAKALISVINDDYANLEIGLNARSFQPDLRLILRIFDSSMAQVIRQKLNIHLTLSMSAIADEHFLAMLNNEAAL